MNFTCVPDVAAW